MLESTHPARCHPTKCKFPVAFLQIQNNLQNAMMNREPKIFDLLGAILVPKLHKSTDGKSYYSMVLRLAQPNPWPNAWIAYPHEVNKFNPDIFDHISRFRWDIAFREPLCGVITCNVGTQKDPLEMGTEFWDTIRTVLAVRYYRLKILQIPLVEGNLKAYDDMIDCRFGAMNYPGIELGPGKLRDIRYLTPDPS